MIGIFNTHTKEMKLFEKVEGLFKYITALENEKMLEDHKHFGKTEWSFIIFSRKDVHELYHNSKKDDLTEELKQAYQQELELLEVCHGDCQTPAQLPLTPDIDLEELKMDWCRAYCITHQFYLAEDS